ncbi:hypothetical protein EPO04_03240 [Patescibacteria group bacterium]|nr:MAG: hypothetical protein EPO04_03240 [Patescibacteria group bacterium]
MKRLALILMVPAMLVTMLGSFSAPAYADTDLQKACKDKGGVPVSTIWNGRDKSGTPNHTLGDECIGDSSQNPIFAFLSAAIRWFSAIFGLILILIVAIAGFQYVISAGDSSQVQGAKDRLKGAVTGLVLYLLMFSILQFLLPEGAKVFR